MAENLIFTAKEAAFLKELAKQGVSFMIVGLSAANLQGASVVTQDVDLWFRDLADPKIKQALAKVGGHYIPSVANNPPMFAGKNVQFFDIVLNMHGLNSFNDEVKQAIEVPLGRYKIKVLALDRIIASKEAANRQKDQFVLPALKDAWQTIQETKK